MAQTQNFKDELGQFSQTRFRQALAQANLSEEDYLRRLDKALLQEQIDEAITGGARGAREMAGLLAAYQLETRTASVKTVKAGISAVAPPGEDVLSAFYETVKEGYSAPDLRRFELILISPETVSEQITVADADIEDAYSRRRAEFVTPERRQVRQMVFENQEQAVAARAELEAGSSFAAVAEKMLGWTENDIELGLVSKDELADELAEPVFSAATGAVQGPVQSVFGYHLVVVDTVEAGAEASLADVRDEIEDTLRGEQAIDRVYDLVAQLEDIMGSGATMQEAAARTGLSVSQLYDIDVNGRNIDGALVTDSIGDLASDSLFLAQSWALDMDEVSPVIETAGNSFFVVKTVAQSPARERSLSEVRDRLVADWTRIQALAAAKARAEAESKAPEKAFAGTQKSPAFNRNGAGLDNEAASLIAQAAFAQEAGQTQLVETGESVILVRTDEIIAAEDESLKLLTEQLSISLGNLAQNDMAAALVLTFSEMHELELNPAGVQQLLLGQSAQ